MKATVLITAYAVNPYKGSEDGTGWNNIIQSARHHNVIAITRKNNQEHIDRYILEHSEMDFQKLSFEYFDLPYWMRFWKKGTIGALVYFYLWQLCMPLFIYRRKISFDIAHNLNFHNDWIPTFLWVFGKPLIWGPVGHHPVIPFRYIIRTYGYKALIIDRANTIIKTIVRRLDPFMYIALWRADIILAVNSTTAKKYPWVKHKIQVFSAIGGTAPDHVHKTKSEKFILFSAGRLEPIKGFDIALLAYNRFCEKLSKEELSTVSFRIAGSGRYQSKLSSIAKKGPNPNSVEFLAWVPKENINSLYREASVFFFPSHEGAGMVIPEALSFGLPIVCFNNAGPGESSDIYSALKVDYNTFDVSVEALSEHLLRLFRDENLRNKIGVAARARFDEVFDWNKKGVLLNEMYIQLLNHYEKKYPVYTPA